MDFSVFQEAISKIDGVLNVKIVQQEDSIQEVHILANKLRSPKQIVRDIESSLIASFDYKIDRKVISIAQIDTDETRAVNRIKFEGISVSSSGTVIECSIKLNYEDEEYEAGVSGVKTILNSRKLVAEATIRAIDKITGQASLFDVQDVIVTTNRDITFVSVIVNMITELREEVMIGSAIAKNDLNEAIVKATLDAVNRRLQRTNI